jgi:hypothetical protein
MAETSPAMTESQATSLPGLAAQALRAGPISTLHGVVFAILYLALPHPAAFAAARPAFRPENRHPPKNVPSNER